MIAMRARNNLGFALTYRDPVAALELLRSGIADAERLGLNTWVLGLWDQAADAARTTGEWDWSLAGLERLLSTDLVAEHRAAMLRQVITLIALRGDPVEHELAEMDRLLADTTSPTLRATSNQAHASVAFATGDLKAARDEYVAAAHHLAELKPTATVDAARCSLWSGDVDSARSDLAAHDVFGAHGPLIEARRASIAAGIAALEGRIGDALALYRTALLGCHGLQAKWDEALIGIDMATLLDPSIPEVRAAAGSARDILAQLRATPLLARLDEAMSRPTATVLQPEDMGVV